MRRVHKSFLAIGLAVMSVATGCASQNSKTKTSEGDLGTVTVLSTPTTRPAVMNPASVTYGELFYPSGSPETSSLKLAKSVPDELHVGKPYQYTLSVTNISQATLNNVAVTETLSPGFSIGDVDGARVTNKDGRARMLVGELAPGETRKIIVNATVSTAGSQSSCASVTFDTSLCMDVNVVSPSIKVAIAKGTESSTVVCKATVLKFDITNDGTGVARNSRF